MMARNSCAYLDYVGEFVDQYNKAYHGFISKKPVDANDSDLTEEFETNPEAPKFKSCNRVRITKYNNIFSKCYVEK